MAWSAGPCREWRRAGGVRGTPWARSWVVVYSPELSSWQSGLFFPFRACRSRRIRRWCRTSAWEA